MNKLKIPYGFGTGLVKRSRLIEVSKGFVNWKKYHQAMFLSMQSAGQTSGGIMSVRIWGLIAALLSRT